MTLRIAVLMILTSTGLHAAEPKMKPGTYYTSREIGISKKQLKGTKLHLTFKPKDEQFHWCPGVKYQATKKAVVLTFVRCSTAKNCNIDKKAAIGKKLIRTITIDTRGLDVYVCNGPKQYKRIHKAPKTAKKKDGRQAKWSPSATTHEWVINEFASVKDVTASSDAADPDARANTWTSDHE